MKTLIFVFALLMPIFSYAEVQERMIRVFCGSEADLTLTIEKYKEKPIILATNSSDMMYSVWVNLETQTSTWIVKAPEPNTYCVMGVGESLNIFDPNDSKPKTKTKKYKKPQF